MTPDPLLAEIKKISRGIGERKRGIRKSLARLQADVAQQNILLDLAKEKYRTKTVPTLSEAMRKKPCEIQKLVRDYRFLTNRGALDRVFLETIGILAVTPRPKQTKHERVKSSVMIVATALGNVRAELERGLRATDREIIKSLINKLGEDAK